MEFSHLRKGNGSVNCWEKRQVYTRYPKVLRKNTLWGGGHWRKPGGGGPCCATSGSCPRRGRRPPRESTFWQKGGVDMNKKALRGAKREGCIRQWHEAEGESVPGRKEFEPDLAQEETGILILALRRNSLGKGQSQRTEKSRNKRHRWGPTGCQPDVDKAWGEEKQIQKRRHEGPALT